MVAMPKLSGRQRLESRVVLGIRGRQYSRLGASEFEKHPFKSCQPRLIKVFDDFDDRCGVEPGQSFVAVHERSLNQLYAFLLLWRQSVKVKALGGNFETPVRHVHSE